MTNLLKISKSDAILNMIQLHFAMPHGPCDTFLENFGRKIEILFSTFKLKFSPNQNYKKITN